MCARRYGVTFNTLFECRSLIENASEMSRWEGSIIDGTLKARRFVRAYGVNTRLIAELRSSDARMKR